MILLHGRGVCAWPVLSCLSPVSPHRPLPQFPLPCSMDECGPLAVLGLPWPSPGHLDKLNLISVPQDTSFPCSSMDRMTPTAGACGSPAWDQLTSNLHWEYPPFPSDLPWDSCPRRCRKLPKGSGFLCSELCICLASLRGPRCACGPEFYKRQHPVFLCRSYINDACFFRLLDWGAELMLGQAGAAPLAPWSRA